MCVYTVYIHLSPQWAEPCVCSVFLEMCLWFTQKCWNNPAAWVRSSKALQIRRDTDLGQSKGLMALLISFFLEEGSEEFFLFFFLWSSWVSCFWQDDLFDVTLWFSGKPYQDVIFHTFSLALVHLRPCVQYTLCSSLLLHVYHTSLFLHSHIIYLKGDIFGF